MVIVIINTVIIVHSVIICIFVVANVRVLKFACWTRMLRVLDEFVL